MLSNPWLKYTKTLHSVQCITDTLVKRECVRKTRTVRVNFAKCLAVDVSNLILNSIFICLLQTRNEVIFPLKAKASLNNKLAEKVKKKFKWDIKFTFLWLALGCMHFSRCYGRKWQPFLAA